MRLLSRAKRSPLQYTIELIPPVLTISTRSLGRYVVWLGKTMHTFLRSETKIQ